MADDPDAISGPAADNVIPFKRVLDLRVEHANESGNLDDDELV
jgi:hypothetical protein